MNCIWRMVRESYPFGDEFNRERAVLFDPSDLLGPVPVTLPPADFDQPGHHHDQTDVFLLHTMPKVTNGLFGWT